MDEEKVVVSAQKDFAKPERVFKKNENKDNKETKEVKKVEEKAEEKVENKVEKADPKFNSVSNTSNTSNVSNVSKVVSGNTPKKTGKVIVVSPYHYVVKLENGSGVSISGKHNKKIGDTVTV